jgi:hypothetical protein
LTRPVRVNPHTNMPDWMQPPSVQTFQGDNGTYTAAAANPRPGTYTAAAANPRPGTYTAAPNYTKVSNPK